MADTANGQAQAITVLQRPGGLGCAALSLKDKNARETSKWLEKVAGSNYLLNGTDGEKKKLADKASQNDGINADSPDNLNLLVLYGTVMKRTGFPVLIDVSSKSCVKNLKATIVDFANSTDAKVKLSSSEKKALRDGIASLESKGILTRGLQDLVIKRGMADQQRIDSVKKTTSNDLINRPDAAIKVELKNRKFDVQGIRVVDNKIVVDDASFRGVDIEHVIRCFKDKNYHIFFELPSFNDRIVRKLIEINDGYSAYGLNELEHGVLIKLADDINQGGKSIDNNGDDLSGLDDVDMGVLASIITKLEARASSDDDKETVVMLNLAKKGLKKYSRGLSRDEIYFLSSLLDLMKSGQKSVPTRIKMGETNLDEYPAQYRSTIRSGLKVLERIGQELAAVAVQAEKKVDKKANTFDEIKELYTESFKRTVEYADMRQAVATSAPPGYIILLKAEFFRNTYLKEMKELSKLFYGETDSSGNKITTGIFDNVKGDVKSMISRLNAMGAHQEAIAKQINEGRYSSTSEFNDLYASYCNLYNARVKLSDEITAVSNMDPETQIKYERYKQVVRYMMSEEIDYEFISKLQTVNPQAFDKAVDLTDPYTEEMVKMSPKQLIMGDGGKDSIISKFRNGETWISSNIVVGEGKKSDKYVLAKQALASMLAKMALTQNTVNFTGPLAFFAGAGILTRLKINPTAAFIVAKSLGPVSADLMPKIGIKTGVQTYADLKATDVDWMRKATGGIVDNFAMQTGTRANQNLGKAWMDHIGQRSDNPGGMLVKSVGHDAMLCKNRMDAEYVGKIIKYVDDLNDRAHGNVMNPETGKKEYKYEVEAKVASKLEELKKNDMPLAVIDLSSKKSISKIKDGLEDLKEAMGRLGKGKQYIDLQ